MKTIKVLLLGFLLFISSCASTTFYADNGQKVAEWEGNLDNTEYTRDPSGAITWKATKVNHSSATTASGSAITKGIGAAGAAMVTGALVP